MQKRRRRRKRGRGKRIIIRCYELTPSTPIADMVDTWMLGIPDPPTCRSDETDADIMDNYKKEMRAKIEEIGDACPKSAYTFGISSIPSFLRKVIDIEVKGGENNV